MITKRKIIFYLIGTFFILFFSCKKEQDKYPDLIINVPEGFPEPVYDFSNNPMTREKVELGRFLFYDPILSKDSSISCGTCHAQEHGFADHNVALSLGVDNKVGRRNSPDLANLLWVNKLNWDGGINHIEVQPIAPITEEVEMAETLTNVVDKLNRSPFYKAQFSAAFGEGKINDQQILFALSQFMVMMVSADSKYDQYKEGKAEFTIMEELGLELFQKNCSSCHSGELLTNLDFANNGLVEGKADDLGRFEITQKPEDKWKFRVPSLRNVDLTYPYMHDGSVFSLENVVEGYSSGGTSHRDPRIPNQGFQFSYDEKLALVRFLKTLTDWNFITNRAFAPPNY